MAPTDQSDAVFINHRLAKTLFSNQSSILHPETTPFYKKVKRDKSDLAKSNFPFRLKPSGPADRVNRLVASSQVRL